MTLIAVCSLKGSPGVTTFSVALAARWPVTDRCVLVECDPSGGDMATRFALASSPGLVSLAAATRRSTDPGSLASLTCTIVPDSHRWFRLTLPGGVTFAVRSVT